MKQEFEFWFRIRLTDKSTPEMFAVESDNAIKMKGEFKLQEIDALNVAVVAEFITCLATKLKAAKDGGYQFN
jgi:hypothetical protein